ncbi:MAG: hypothetical protein LBJ12_08705 [Oscillospiraceae bacterium]|nr:hypothetical protein [Oscillospiraceae bacterium]
MMQQRQIGNAVIEFDRAATQAAYSNPGEDWLCSCQDCLNYYAAAPNFPTEVIAFFDELGMNVTKPSEVYDCSFQNDLLQYCGFYHLYGNIKYTESSKLQLADGFECRFSSSLACVPSTFSNNRIQLNIYFTVPWVLDEPRQEPIPIILSKTKPNILQKLLNKIREKRFPKAAQK